jgi:hypothetical protein
MTIPYRPNWRELEASAAPDRTPPGRLPELKISRLQWEKNIPPLFHQYF